MTTEISKGNARFLGLDTSEEITQEKVFELYRLWQDSIKQLDAKIKTLKPYLIDIVEDNGGKFEHDGYVAQMIESKPTKSLKTKDEVLAVVPKKYHWNILKDVERKPYLKVAVAPKDNIAEVIVNKSSKKLQASN